MKAQQLKNENADLRKAKDEMELDRYMQSRRY
jgi:hypothetical protein